MSWFLRCYSCFHVICRSRYFDHHPAQFNFPKFMTCHMNVLPICFSIWNSSFPKSYWNPHSVKASSLTSAVPVLILFLVTQFHHNLVTFHCSHYYFFKYIITQKTLSVYKIQTGQCYPNIEKGMKEKHSVPALLSRGRKAQCLTVTWRAGLSFHRYWTLSR